MRITEAARRLDTSPRMLRYRDLLGLLPPVREPPPGRGHARARPPVRAANPSRATARPSRAAVNLNRLAAHAGGRGETPRPAGGRGDVLRPVADRAPGHRRFGEDDLAAVSLALGIEQRYDISPAALAFGLRVLTEPGVRADVAELARRIGRVGPLPARALEFEKERALRLLSLAPGRRPERRANPSSQQDGAAGLGRSAHQRNRQGSAPDMHER
jgi:MerR family transcriptional regulator, copper efflux regulator